MARAESPGSEDIAADALALLRRDHQLLIEMVREFDFAAKQQLDPLARRLCKLLRVHSQIQEEIFFPAARRALPDTALIDKAERAHAGIKQSIRLIESINSDDAAFARAVATLADDVKAEIVAEEDGLFPKVKESGIDLLSIGISLAERRDTLMVVLGMHADDEEAAVIPEVNPAIAVAAAQRQKERDQ